MEGKQQTLFLVALVCVIISTTIVALRAIVRLSIKGFGIDDWLMAGGQIFFIATCIVVLYGCKAGLGVKDVDLTVDRIISARHASVSFECLYLTSLFLVKCSICYALLRINTNKTIRNILYLVVFLSFCCSFITIVTVLSICKPVSAAWTGKGTCVSAKVLTGAAYYVTVSSIITDFCCSILPFVILWNLQIARRLKLTIAVILSLGLLASTATLIRASYINRFTATTNYVWGYADLATWSIIEDGIATTVGSIPALKPLFKKLHFLGLSRSEKSNDAIEGSGHDITRKSYAMHTIKPPYFSGFCGPNPTSSKDESESVKNMLREEMVALDPDRERENFEELA